MTRKTPFLFITLQFLQIFLTDARTFTAYLLIKIKPPRVFSSALRGDEKTYRDDTPTTYGRAFHLFF